MKILILTDEDMSKIEDWFKTIYKNTNDITHDIIENDFDLAKYIFTKTNEIRQSTNEIHNMLLADSEDVKEE